MSDAVGPAPDGAPGGACEGHAAAVAELALGALGGRERAATLGHVETCPHCAEELEQLARLSDAVVQVAPEAEPPLGFETRLFERMEVVPPGSRRARRRPARRVLVAAGAAVALGLGLGLGLSIGSSTSPEVSAPVRAQAGLVSAPLHEHGKTVGRVVIDGAKRWMSIMLAGSSARGRVECLVVTKDGATHGVGTFVATAGYGAWIAPLWVKPAAVRTAQVVTLRGTVIATATLR